MATIQNINNGEEGGIVRNKINSNANALNTIPDGQILVGNASNISTPVQMTGDVTITNAGVTAIGAGKVTGTQIATSVALSGSPTTTTQTAGDNSTKIATTAFVANATSTLTLEQLNDVTITSPSNGQVLTYNGTDWVNQAGGGGGGGTWGSITGTLSNQTDLQNALNAKQNLVSTPTNNDILLTNDSGQAIDSGISISTSSTANTDNLLMTAKAVQTALSSVSNGLISSATQNASFVALAGNQYNVDSSSTIIVVTVSTPPETKDGALIMFVDVGGNASNNEIQITNGVAELANITVNYQSIILVYNKTANKWNILSQNAFDKDGQATFLAPIVHNTIDIFPASNALSGRLITYDNGSDTVKISLRGVPTSNPSGYSDILSASFVNGGLQTTTIANVVLFGSTQAPTPSLGDNSTKIATTEFVKQNSVTNTLNSANIFVGNSSNIATGVAVTGDLSITDTGLTTVGTSTPTALTVAKWDSNVNFSANNITAGIRRLSNQNLPFDLTLSDAYQQICVGSLAPTQFTLPDTISLIDGFGYFISNQTTSTTPIAILNSIGTLLTNLNSGQDLKVTWDLDDAVWLIDIELNQKNPLLIPINSNTTLSTGGQVIQVDTSASSVAITLPLLSSFPTGNITTEIKIYLILGTNTLIITTAGSDIMVNPTTPGGQTYETSTVGDCMIFRYLPGVVTPVWFREI